MEKFNVMVKFGNDTVKRMKVFYNLEEAIESAKDWGKYARVLNITSCYVCKAHYCDKVLYKAV